ncbi:MAG TPA: transglutaminase domain-containing protein [Thermoanaerobaculaceae bacterium]|nr:transglutaminase domain-containing protein [Thermoanaerobaculaceae bacterium]
MRRARPALLRLAVAGALAAAIAPGAGALGRPDWAKPFLTLPSPAGGYIAKNDTWAVVYGEVTFSLKGEQSIETRYRLILENMTGGEEAYVMTLAYDEGAQELANLSLDVERTLWHEINLKRQANRVSVAQAEQFIYVSAEKIESHRRVVLEYSLTDRLGVTPWAVEYAFRAEPVARMRYSLAPGAAARGLKLELVTPGNGPAPAGFAQEADGSWTVAAVPALERLRTSRLVYQPSLARLYPCFLVTAGAGEGGSFRGFASRYRGLWDARAKEIDAAQVAERAASLTAGAGSAAEKAARLARFVQHEVQYDATRASSVDAWLPITTRETLRAMKADCKGKAMLAQALFRAIGIDSVPILLHSGLEYLGWDGRLGTALINHVVLAVDLRREPAPYPAALLEGPARDWVLFDPTVETADFGQPLPGFEGFPALFVGDAAEPVFTIRTRTPSVARTRVAVQLALDDDGELRGRVKASDNGHSAFIARLVLALGDEECRRNLALALGEQVPGARLTESTRRRAGVDGGGATSLEFAFTSPQPLQRMSRAALLESPLALVGLVAGLPRGFNAAAPPKPEDVVKLEPPWDARLNTTGMDTAVDASFTLAVPATFGFTPPAPRHEVRPWLAFDLAWAADGAHAWKGDLHLETARGAWPREERKDRVTLMDGLLTDLFAPLMLESAGAAP